MASRARPWKLIGFRRGRTARGRDPVARGGWTRGEGSVHGGDAGGAFAGEGGNCSGEMDSPIGGRERVQIGGGEKIKEKRVSSSRKPRRVVGNGGVGSSQVD